MDYFNYNAGVMLAEEVPVPEIAAAIGTPFYCYSTAALQYHYQAFAKAFTDLNASIFFAVKSNSNLAVIRTLAEEGAGADVVSEGEIRRALLAGVPPNRIVFSGVGKTREELTFALKNNIYQINIESEPELELVNDVSIGIDKIAKIAIRINPDVIASTHRKISTGGKENKFGIPWPEARVVFKRAQKMSNIKVVGLAIHIGSQIFDLDPFEKAFGIAAEAVQDLCCDGIAIKNIDLGGGLGVSYESGSNLSPGEYSNIVKRIFDKVNYHIMLEPGRAIAANAGILVTKVIHVKNIAHKRFLIVDAAMNDFIRPALYEAEHDVMPVFQNHTNQKKVLTEVVGPVCESGDVFRRDLLLPSVLPGALFAIRSAGAYGAVMASTYNSRPLIPEVLVNGSLLAVVRPRQNYEDLLGAEKLAPWQTKINPKGPISAT